MIEIKACHLEKLLIESVRYCLGRSTYAVSECGDIIRLHWKNIGEGAKEVIRRDIRNKIDRHNDSATDNFNNYHERLNRDNSYLGHECDAFTWIELLNWIDEQEN
ncbi:hypothetical protein [Mannheimia pernigra]|uniref:Uncharacterized protein n=1 Tax=Mannheimia pernigra TaxID=111844 RepID=A0A7D5E0E1_9PAST|nr:hypothetical protein [Mannheimia pernigra]QLB40844.1 hypothetical protein HV559_08165 [Mannheimia pernigra]